MTLKELTKLIWAIDGTGIVSDYDIVITGKHETVEAVTIDFKKQNVELWGE